MPSPIIISLFSPGTANLEVSQQRRQCCRRDLEPGDAAVAGQQVVAEVLQRAATGHPGVGEHVEIPPVNSLKHNVLAVDPQVPQLEIQTSQAWCQLLVSTILTVENLEDKI